MKRKMTILLMTLLSLSVTVRAQWAVFDPSNFAQSIVNSANEIVQTSSTAQNMWSNFQETVKIYEQGKAYYDALKSVHDLVKGARKVQQTILLVGDISDINRIYGEVLEYKNLTWYYTRKNIGVSYLRSKEKGDAARVLSLYGTHDQRYW